MKPENKKELCKRYNSLTSEISRLGKAINGRIIRLSLNFEAITEIGESKVPSVSICSIDFAVHSEIPDIFKGYIQHHYESLLNLRNAIFEVIKTDKALCDEFGIEV